MRVTAFRNGVFVKAYSGTTGVMLAMDLGKDLGDVTQFADVPADFLGWAIQRSGGTGREGWLVGMIPFPGQEHEAGEPIRSNIAPIQKFRWSDYAVDPDTEYRYTIHAAHGTPDDIKAGRLTLREGPTVTARTASAVLGEQCILFNRAAAASQAFTRKFQTLGQRMREAPRGAKKDVPVTPDALVWLSRGCKESIVAFIERAKGKGWALDVAIYQYELPDIVDAVRAARDRGVAVRVVYHAKPGDAQTAKNKKSVRGLPAEMLRARVTNAICHHKFIVLSKLQRDGSRAPEAVLCGSTNFTHNGVYRQANMVHVVSQPEVAGQYAGLFDVLFSGKTPAETKAWIDEHNPIDSDAGFAGPIFVGFSPRSGATDLAAFVRAIGGARQDVLFCTTFSLHADVMNALLGAPHDAVLRYGIQDKASRITGFHKDRTADFEATALLPQGLEGFLKESLRADGGSGNILVHLKACVLDFTSDSPTVIAGSHNYSTNASRANDENFLVLTGLRDVADTYGVELMRLYDAYRFRFKAAQAAKAGEAARPLHLHTSSVWAKSYFRRGSLDAADRLLFARGRIE